MNDSHTPDPHDTRDANRVAAGALGRRRAALLLAPALPLLLAQAFIPIESFIHRGDDAYYFFQVAVNYPELGFWSFDGIHPTNGVQPLWAMLLTVIAQVLAWVGVRDVDVLARIFVAVAACLHFASCLLLFDLLSRKVSTFVGIAAAGAFLFPMGIVWARVWGMENSLYALLLVASVWFFHLRFLPAPTPTRAVLLGALLGLTALARLNAALFAWVILLHYLCRPAFGPFPLRTRRALQALLASGALILPYLAWNHLGTDHILPISGAIKSIGAERLLARNEVDSVFSFAFVEMVGRLFGERLGWFVSSRVGDGFWIAGSRVLFSGDSGLDIRRVLLPAIAFCLLAPMLLGRPREWLALLRDRFSRLASFGYLAVFGALNAVICVIVYPHQVRYAIVHWWWVENEIVLVVLTATLVASAIGYVGVRFLSERWRHGATAVLLVCFFSFHAQQMLRYYWSPEFVPYDWRRSWNDESFRAARWLSENVPEDALVGSWNAGVVGYYSKQRVVNLDGLINSFDIVPFIAEDRIADYIREQRISYLSDTQKMLARHGVFRELKLTRVYAHASRFLRQPYVIYRVDE